MVERILKDIEAIARCTETPGDGATRPTFSDAWGRARDYLIEQAKGAGCEVRSDAAGNLHARPGKLGWERKAWLVGSHIDTVPHGGDYDGVAGVVVGLELLRASAESRPLEVELIVFAEEEGPTFGLGMLGSRAWAGELSAEQLAELKNAAGETYLQAGERFGVKGNRLAAERLNPSRYFGLIEVHIEQSPGMWRRGEPLAIVRAIAGRRQYRVVIEGEANHAGATAMSDRRDALAGSAAIVHELEKLAGALSGQTVITVGRLNVHPSAINVIADRVEFTIDMRAPSDAILAEGDVRIHRMVEHICGWRKLKFVLEQTEAIDARPMDEKLIARLADAGEGRLPITVSGALHDSAVLSPVVPTVMLFVASRDGISHNPAEFSRVEDITAAAALVESIVVRPNVAQLSAMDKQVFVAVCGPVFEHSPWIAERTWELGRPFTSSNDLHEKLCGVVSNATSEERVSLIGAHPDLVGQLAREGRLTRESTGEQAAAGLDGLTPEESALFDRFNMEYREKFGFPFVICARENRKEAILAAFPVRLKHSRDVEIQTALNEIFRIARLRLADALWEN